MNLLRLILLRLSLHLRRDFQAQRVEPDESCGVVLIVGFGQVGFHRSVRGLFKQRRQIPHPVQDSRNFNAAVKQAIEDDMVTNHKAAQAGR